MALAIVLHSAHELTSIWGFQFYNQSQDTVFRLQSFTFPYAICISKSYKVSELVFLQVNELTNLPEDIFNDLENLEYLDMMDNNITMIPSLYRLTKVQSFDVTGNNIISFSKTQFTNVSSLVALSLKKNSLIKLQPDVFGTLVELLQLFLGYNYLTTLPTDIFSNLTNLRHLELKVRDQIIFLTIRLTSTSWRFWYR